MASQTRGLCWCHPWQKQPAGPPESKGLSHNQTLVPGQAIWSQELGLTEMTLGELLLIVTAQGLRTGKWFRNGCNLRDGLLFLSWAPIVCVQGEYRFRGT